MKKVGLVLEGGGMRGLYTAGILDFFMDQNLYFPYTIGVSAGACHGSSYISRQRGRSKTVNTNFIKDPRYLSYRNYLKERSVFGMDFIFNQIPNKLVPFDYQYFFNAKEDFVVGATDCISGKPVYFKKDDYKAQENLLDVIKASSSLPFIAPFVRYENFTLLDGGISDPIPIKKSIKDGNIKNVVVLTRNQGYRKKPFQMKWFAKKLYSKYEKLVDTILQRHEIYNATLDYLEELEKKNQVFILRPSQPLVVGRLEKDEKKLHSLYEQGYSDAKKMHSNLQAFLSAAEE